MALAPLPKDDSALSKLNERMQNFARAYVSHGKREAGRAYVEAGYRAANANVARVNACNLLHRADVQLAIQELCRKDLVALAPVANKVAQELLEGGSLDPSVRARLVLGVWDRTGLGSVAEIRHTVEHIGNDPQALGQVRTLIEQLNLTDDQIETMFGRTVAKRVKDVGGTIIDVEAEEIEEDPDALTPEEEEALRQLEAQW